MKYGYFDNENREYVIDKIDVPASWTNYIGVNDMCAVLNHTAGGYSFYKSPEYHRITRFRPNGTPLDRPGRYVYLRDDETGAYWSISWQPVGLPLDTAKYECRHGLSYSAYSCVYNGINAKQTQLIPVGDPVEIWDIVLTNDSDKPRKLSVFAYCEFSYHHIEMDNKNFQMSNYAAGSSFSENVIDYDLFYEKKHQFFTCNEAVDSFDCLRDSFLGLYHTETNPAAVINGTCSGSFELTGNHCGALHKRIELAKGETARLAFLLGEGGIQNGKNARQKYNFAEIDKAFAGLKLFWEEKLCKLQVNTPSQAMNTMLNIWTLYQSEINVMFSRFASFIEVGGRTGLGYRDTAQDAMTIPHSNPEKCLSRIIELLKGLTSAGYGLHLFSPEWFEPQVKPAFKSPTVVPMPDRDTMIHGIKDACADDALWLVAAVNEYIKETGEIDLLDKSVTYADGGEGSVYEHLCKILDFSAKQIGENGICKGLRADWNDCLNLGDGESAMVSFLHYWALQKFIELAEYKHKKEPNPKLLIDIGKYRGIAANVKKACDEVLWDGKWFIRGITGKGKKIGTAADTEGKVHMESNTWAVLSGAADDERGIMAMDAVDEYLYTEYGLMLNAPAYSVIDDDIGFVTRVYKGVKENGAIFSHPNPWAWCAESILGRGDRAMKFYDALCPYHQNDKIEIRQSEPYSYCQFIMGKDHTAFGRARHPFMTGSGGWSYFAATRYILGIRPEFDSLTVDPCIPADWKEFSVIRVFRGVTYHIHIKNPDGVMKGIKSIFVNGNHTDKIPVGEAGSAYEVTVTMG